MEPWSERDKIAHLLRRFGLGASEQELDYYGKDGLKGAIDLLLNYESHDAGPVSEITAFVPEDKPNQLKPQQVRAWWIHRIIATHRPLEEKMTLFWHDHFATSAVKVAQGTLMHTQNEILRKNATGNFETLLTEVSKDPAMIYWLDNQFNVKGKPNENFAREVMELFTLGIGNYTEKDIQEAARAFTGWQYGQPKRDNKNKGDVPKRTEFVFRANLHDDGEKTILGKSGSFSGEDVLHMLCENIQTARYITTKLWEWFAYANPEQKLINRLTATFRGANLEIKPLLRAIMESDEFYSPKAIRSIYKNPVDFTVATCRQLGLGVALEFKDGRPQGRGALPILAVITATNAMGMELLEPPDVSGWEGGQAWISSATMVERIKWADRLFGRQAQGQRAKGYMGIPVGQFVNNATPEEIVIRLISIFDAPITTQNRSKMVEAARSVSGGAVNAKNANEVCQAVTRMIFGSPEFQFA